MVDASSTFTIEVEVDATNVGGAFASLSSQIRGATSGLDTELNKIDKSLGSAGESGKKLSQNLSTTRYALYDVSRTATIAGTALLGMAVATTAVAVAWERDFAQVVRTTGVTGDAVGALRNDLVELAQTMPTSFGDLAQIATLAGQLGVAEDRVASFTETVAKISAVTDLTVDAAATAFGRLDALLPDVQGQYEELGSSIAKVGVNSVATESQIVAISTQISSMGAFAGLTAAEVIGLSGALASVGGAPELSRGTITRVFTQMQKAISESGDALDGFARIAGVSGDEFANSFGTNRFGPIFKSFIQGLGDSAKTGGDATAALRDLGITSVRDVPLLLKLAGAGDTLNNAFADAKSGFEDGTELTKQYGVIANTTAAKLQVLTNNFQALLDALGSGALGPLSAALDWAVQFLQRITDLTKSPIGQWVGGLTTALVGLIGVFALVAGATVAGFAGIVAMQQALTGLTGQAATAGIGLKGLIAQLAATGGAGKVASVAIRGLGVALKALSIIGLALVLPDILGWGADVGRAAKGLDGGFSDSLGRVQEAFRSLNDNALEDFGAFGATINRFTAGADWGITRDIRDVDEALAEMVSSGNVDEARKTFQGLRREWLDGGGQLDAFNAYFIDSKKALDEYSPAADAAAEVTDELAAAEEAAAVAAETFAASIGLTPEAVDTLRSNLTSGSEAFFDMAAAIEAATTEAGVSVQEFLAQLESQVTAQANFADNLGDIAARGAVNFASELAKGGPGAAEAAAAMAGATDAELAKAEQLAITRGFNTGDGYAQGFTENIPLLQQAFAFGGQAAVDSMQVALSQGESAVVAELEKMKAAAMARPVPIGADVLPALAELNALQRRINETTGSVTVYTTYKGGYAPIRDPLTYRYASGGYISGPGTGTSDSIPARLSNGEFVVKAAAVQKYGTAFFDALNSARVPRFAHGGQVGVSASAGGDSMMGGVVELGPKSLARLSQSVTNNILLDDAAISRASQRGDRKRRASGDL